jgi:hypothetical protein
VGFFLAINISMIEWILIVHLSVTSPEFEIWGGYQDHINCLSMQEKLATHYQQKKRPMSIRTRCQPVMAVQLEPRK